MSQSRIQRTFAGGELSPALYARADLAKFQSGLRTCRNFVVMRHGGVQNRSGYRWLGEVKDSTKATYLLPFIFNDDQTYLLEIGDQYMRFWRNDARVLVSGVAAYNGATAYVVGDLVVQGGVNYYCKAATTGNAPPNATYWYPLTGSIYEIPTPYTTAELPDVQAAQQNDLVLLTHTAHFPQQLSRSAHTRWLLANYNDGPRVTPPTALTLTAGAAGPGQFAYVVTAIDAVTNEESLQSAVLSTPTNPNPAFGGPVSFTWTPPAGITVREYRVYRSHGYGVGMDYFCYVGSSAGVGFTDNGGNYLPGADGAWFSPPKQGTTFPTSADYPACAAFYKQRVVFANTPANASRVLASRLGAYSFTESAPLQDDDAVSFSLLGRRTQDIRHLVELKRLIALTGSGEWVVKGDEDGVLTPFTINAEQEGANGASSVQRPRIIGTSVVYVQARGTILRDLKFDLDTNGYVGKDLTVFASHLFDEYAIKRYDYAQIPHSIIWCVRNDGTLLGLTYVQEQDVWGWHRHDTGASGKFEDVCVLPQGTEDVPYVVVNRTIGGTTKRYIERLTSRVKTNTADFAKDCFFVDAGLTYDGRNTGATTMTLSTAGGWTETDLLTVTASANAFTAGDVGNEVWLSDATGLVVRVRIDSFTSATVVKGYPHRNVPATLQAIARTTWSLAVDEIANLTHLEGQVVAVLGDGSVIFNGADTDSALVTQFTVTGGQVTLTRHAAVINAGLPIQYPDLELLDLDVDGTTVRDKRKRLGSVSLLLEFSRGGWAGPSTDDGKLFEFKYPTAVTALTVPTPYTGRLELSIPSTWGTDGRVSIRQKDPLPLTILALIPNGEIGG